jgi:hypothetical protein
VKNACTVSCIKSVTAHVRCSLRAVVAESTSADRNIAFVRMFSVSERSTNFDSSLSFLAQFLK